MTETSVRGDAPQSSATAESREDPAEDVIKIFNFVDPLPGRLEASERYYVDVHVPLIARTLARDSRWLSYYQNRLVAEYDALGGFEKESSRWRLVMLRGRVEQDGGQRAAAARPNNAKLQRVIELDHPNFVGGIHRLEADETVVHDTLAGQTALTKFLICFPPNPSGAPLSAQAAAEVGEEAARSDGCRLVLRSDIRGEVGSTTVGRAIVPSSEYIETPTFAHIVELYFDNRLAPRGFFTDPAIQMRLNYADVAPEVFAVEETCGFDRR